MNEESYNSRSEPLKVLMIQAWDGGRLDYFVSPPLGINRVRKWAENELGPSVDIECFDPNMHLDARERLKRKVAETSYDVMAFSPLHLTMENDLALMHDIHTISPNALYVAGGQQSAFAWDLIGKYAPFMDAIITGEGEKPFTEILKITLENSVSAVSRSPGTYLGKIPGMYVKGQGRNPGFNMAMGDEDFKKATFLLDFKDLDIESYWAVLEHNRSEEELKDPKWMSKIYTLKPYTTNYCPMNCSFCSTTNFYKDAGDGRAPVTGIRGKDLEDYITGLFENQPRARTVLFKDDLWFIRGKGGRVALLEDLAALKKVREKFPNRDVGYHGKARVDTFVDPKTLVIDEELYKATVDAGFRGISFGLESFDVEELDYYNKRLGPNGPEVNKLAALSATGHGLNVVSYIILSGLVSRPDTIFRTLKGCTDLVSRGEIVTMNPYLYALPGTDIARDIENHPELVETKTYPVPGYPEMSVERVVKIAPRDKRAREIIDEFETRMPNHKEETQKRLKVKDWICEFSTPAQLELIAKIGLEKEFFPEAETLQIIKDLNDLMLKYKREDRVAREVTYA